MTTKTKTKVSTSVKVGVAVALVAAVAAAGILSISYFKIRGYSDSLGHKTVWSYLDLPGSSVYKALEGSKTSPWINYNEGVSKTSPYFAYKSSSLAYSGLNLPSEKIHKVKIGQNVKFKITPTFNSKRVSYYFGLCPVEFVGNTAPALPDENCLKAIASPKPYSQDNTNNIYDYTFEKGIEAGKVYDVVGMIKVNAGKSSAPKISFLGADDFTFFRFQALSPEELQGSAVYLKQGMTNTTVMTKTKNGYFSDFYLNVANSSDVKMLQMGLQVNSDKALTLGSVMLKDYNTGTVLGEVAVFGGKALFKPMDLNIAKGTTKHLSLWVDSSNLETGQTLNICVDGSTFKYVNMMTATIYPIENNNYSACLMKTVL